MNCHNPQADHQFLKIEVIGRTGMAFPMQGWISMNRYFSAEEWAQWQFGLQQANHNNVLCHCRQCDRQWIAS
ncbi:hypothetical protein, partial [Haemophilus parainfluenzae]|uniref:hypothetical protein n=1 Tax=Haemophilus parainfluenzae TaxID=729 RepID=UPI001CEDAB4C